MNLSRRGFLGALAGLIVGAKVAATPRKEVAYFEVWQPPVEPPAFTGSTASPYSIPAFVNEAGQRLAEHPERWRFLRERTTWTDHEVLLNDWPSTRAHRGPRGKMRKAPRDQAWYERNREPGVRLSDFIKFVEDTGARPVFMDDRDDERREIVERQWRALWAVPTGSKVA